MTKTLKRITTDEVETLQKISIETFSDTFKDQNSAQDLADYLKTAYDLNKLTAELNDPNSQFYFVYLDGQLAGYLKVNLNEAQSEQVAPNALEIERIYIRSAFKRHGLGRFLFQEALKQKIAVRSGSGCGRKTIPPLLSTKKWALLNTARTHFSWELTNRLT